MTKLRFVLLGAFLTLTASGCCCWNPYYWQGMLLVEDGSTTGELTTFVSAEEIAAFR